MSKSKAIASGCLAPCVILLVIVGTFVFVAWDYMPFHPIRWPEGQHIDPQDHESRWYVYASRLRDPTQSFTTELGESVRLPNRIILVSGTEREDAGPMLDVRLGDGYIRVPIESLTFDLTGIDLAQLESEFNRVYATDGLEYKKTVIYIDRLEDHNGLPTYVMAHLMHRTAARCVWSVGDEGEPIPLTFTFTTDRNGYRYKDSITREEALYKDLLLPEN